MGFVKTLHVVTNIKTGALLMSWPNAEDALKYMDVNDYSSDEYKIIQYDIRSEDCESEEEPLDATDRDVLYRIEKSLNHLWDVIECDSRNYKIDREQNQKLMQRVEELEKDKENNSIELVHRRIDLLRSEALTDRMRTDALEKEVPEQISKMGCKVLEDVGFCFDRLIKRIEALESDMKAVKFLEKTRFSTVFGEIKMENENK